MKERKMPPGEVPHALDKTEVRSFGQRQEGDNKSRQLQLSDSELYGCPGSVYEELIDQAYVQVQRHLYSYNPF